MNARTKNKLQFDNVKSVEEIKAIIEDALQYDNLVENKQEAEQFFRDAEMEGDMITRDVISTTVSIWNEEMQGEEVYDVRVREHYIDPGSVDYVYSYSIR